jgi:hypothetical protein
VRVNVSGYDEAARMATAVNLVAERMENTVAGVLQAASHLNVRWRLTHQLSDSLQVTAEQTSVQAAAATESSQLISNNVLAVASATEELAGASREIANHAAETLDGARQGSREAESSEQTVRELGSASREVGDFVRAIAALASQTKLLALNASIEAAHVGAAGEGFAVVAQEVRALATAAAGATDSAGRIAAEINEGSGRVTVAIETILATMHRVADSQASIAAMVAEQSYATQEIGQLATQTAAGSTEITGNIEAISEISRRLAYGGSEGMNVASELAELELMLSRLAEGLIVGVSPMDPLLSPTEGKSAVELGGIIMVKNNVRGDDLHQFRYEGTWLHSRTNQQSGDSDSYSCIPGDTAILRFRGRRVRFYAVTDFRHGMAALSVDGGSETIVDEYNATRGHGVLLWTSPSFPSGEHELMIRVIADTNPAARYNWVTVDRVEIEQ